MKRQMKMITQALALAILMWATPAMAGDVDGKWAGTVSTPGGDFPVAFEFKADGTMLTGSTSSPDGGMVMIKDGKIDGTKIAFGVTLDLGGMALEISYTGVVSAEEIKMTADVAGMPIDFVVKKAK